MAPLEADCGLQTCAAGAFPAEPEIRLRGEPFGIPDAQTGLVVLEEYLGLRQHRRHTVVHATDDIEEAILLGDRIAVMSGRPGRFMADMPIDMPPPRDRENLLPGATGLRLKIRGILRDEVAHVLGIAA